MKRNSGRPMITCLFGWSFGHDSTEALVSTVWVGFAELHFRLYDRVVAREFKIAPERKSGEVVQGP